MSINRGARNLLAGFGAEVEYIEGKVESSPTKVETILGNVERLARKVESVYFIS